MSEEQGPGASNLGGGATIDTSGGSIDMDALKDFSREEFAEEFPDVKARADNAGVEVDKGKATRSKSDFEEIFDDEEEDGEDDFEDEDEDEEDLEDEDSDEGTDEDEEDEDEDESGEAGTVEVQVVGEDGKKQNLKIPLNTEFQLKVDGKKRTISLAEMQRQASGNISIHEEKTALGRQRAAFDEEVSKFNEQTQRVNDNAAMLMELATTGDPQDFVLYFADLSGKAPEKVMEEMIINTAKYWEKFSKMDAESRKLWAQNKRYEYQEKKKTVEQRSTSKAEAREKRQQQILKSLKENGLTEKDWDIAADDIVRLVQAGEIDESRVNEDFVVDHAKKLSYNKKIDASIQRVSRKLVNDKDFTARVRDAVIREESLRGKPLTAKGVRKLTRQMAEKLGKQVGESLSRKARKNDSLKRPNSQNAHSRKRSKKERETSDDDDITLEEHRDRMLGLA